MKNFAASELSGLPLTVPSEESSTPFLPIWSRSLLPSWVYFCTMPDGALAIQTLPSLSKWQECRRGSSSFGSPQEFTTLPAASNSIICGASLPPFRSPSSTSCRLRMNTWSWASTHKPPRPPRIQWSGRGLGQFTSASYLGAVCGLQETSDKSKLSPEQDKPRSSRTGASSWGPLLSFGRKHASPWHLLSTVKHRAHAVTRPRHDAAYRFTVYELERICLRFASRWPPPPA